MPARLHVLLPFELTVPDGAEFQLYTFESDCYQVRFEVPSRSGKPPAAEHVTLNEKPSYQADVITITFQKNSINRNIDHLPLDPPDLFINSVLNYFIGCLRYAAQASQVKSINFPYCQWILEYLNDDGSELTPDPAQKLLRRRMSKQFSVSLLGCDANLWGYIFSLPAEFEPPAWHSLLLDSRAAFPGIGHPKSAPGRNRTCDLALRRHSLYPLSYRGQEPTAGF